MVNLSAVVSIIKNKTKHIAKFLVLGVFSFSVVLSALSAVNAQSNGLGISPRKDYTIEAGENIKDRLYLDNLSDKDRLTVNIRVVDFKAADESGAPELDRREDVDPTPWSLRPFIDVPSKVTVEPGEAVFVPFSIAIPAGQGAGSYYSAIEYVAVTDEQEQVSIAASTATLVFAKVPGETKQLLQLEQFGAYEASRDGEEGAFKGLFFSGPPRELAYRLTNEGNIAEQPSGSIIIKNIFGKEVKIIDDANPKDALALLGQTRRFQVCIETEEQVVKSQNETESTVTSCKTPQLKPGRYTAELALLYGENGNNTKEVTAQATFWYLPAWFILLVALILGAVLALGTYLYKKIRRPRISRSSR
jgi:hypothetical protein